MLELLSVIVLIGLLAAVAAPTFIRLLSEQRSDAAIDTINQTLQRTQLKAQQDNVSWQLSIKEEDGIVKVSSHPATTNTASSMWTELDSFIQIDSETTLLSSAGVYYVRFDEKGNVRSSRLGRITVSSKQSPETKRCVVVSTLLGATRVAKQQKEPDPNYSASDRFCY